MSQSCRYTNNFFNLQYRMKFPVSFPITAKTQDCACCIFFSPSTRRKVQRLASRRGAKRARVRVPREGGDGQ